MNAWRTARQSAPRGAGAARPVAPRRGRARAAVVRAIIESDPQEQRGKQQQQKSGGGMNAAEVREREADAPARRPAGGAIPGRRHHPDARNGAVQAGRGAKQQQRAAMATSCRPPPTGARASVAATSP